MHTFPPFVLTALGVLAWSGPSLAQTSHVRQSPEEVPRSPAGLFGFLHHALPSLPFRATRYFSAELNGDGHPDLLATTTSSRAYVLLGEGGYFRTVAHVPSLPSPAFQVPGSIALGDVDGDDDIDAYLGPNTLVLNDGAGGFTDASASLPPSVSGVNRFFADVELDGDLDIVTWGYNAAHTQLRNDGLGHFTDWSASMPSTLLLAFDAAMGDWDGDGDDDAILGSNNNQKGRLYRNQAGTFVDASANLPFQALSSPEVALEDVDRDGDLDALVQDFSVLQSFPFGTRLYHNNGSGSFVEVPSPFSRAIGDRLESGDFDGDDDPDVLIDRVYWNDGGGGFVPGYVPPFRDPGGRLYPVLLADADGDDDLDALAVRNDSFDELFLNDGQGTWSSPSASDLEGLKRGIVTVGDVDGDLDLDLFQNASLLLNDGSGIFEDVSSTHLPTPTLQKKSAVVKDGALGDIAEDGALDAVLALTSLSETFRVYVNEGAGTFHEPPTYPPIVGDTFQVALGDVDGNGHLDVLFAGIPREFLLLGDGSGGFVDGASHLPASAGSMMAAALGDMDGDGDLDGVVGKVGGPTILYENDGAGQLGVAVPNLPSVNEMPQYVVFEDVDVDGDQDLLVSNGLSSSGVPLPSHLYRNDGSGVFTDAPGHFPNGGGRIATGDADGDGDPDVLGNSSDRTLFLANDGSGRFHDLTSELPFTVLFGNSVLADMDQDGDLDAVFDHFLLHNLRRQVAWRSPPHQGEPLELDLYGKSGAFWWIYGALSRGVASVPPYGTLLLDPDESIFLASGILNGRGRASRTLTPAELPGLAGQTLYLQAVIGAPLRFSNLEVATFSGL